MIPCWIVTVGWIEHPEINGTLVRTELGLPDRAPFLVAGVCETRREGRRMAIQMQDAPAQLAHLGERLPLPYDFSVIGSQDPRQIIGRIQVIA